jgi:hypothetical protein
MKIFNLWVLLVLLVTQSASTQAADLTGAWAINTASCDQVFTKKNNKIAFKEDADLNAGGLIIQGKQITGTMGKCTIKSLHDEGSNLKLIAACSDGVMVSDVAYDVKISGENNITLSQKEPVSVEMQYVRCRP